MKRALAITTAAAMTGFASLLATAAPASAIHPCQSYEPPDYCFEEPPPPAPAAPASLTAPSVLQTSVTLQWTDQSSSETAFNIRRVIGGVASYFSVGANSTSFTDTTAPAGRYIEYYVSAERCDEVACSSSASVRLAVQTNPQPANPTGMLNSGSNDQGAWGYYTFNGWALDFDTLNPIQVSVVENGVVTQTMTADRASSGSNTKYPGYGSNHGYYFHVPKKTVKGTYTLCVRATNVGGGVDTNLLCRSYTVPGPPSAATNLTLTNTGTSIVIGFTDNANDETGYVLQRSTDAQASWLSVGSQYPAINGSGSRGSATDYSSPPAGTCYRILMVNSSGGTPSTAVCT